MADREPARFLRPLDELSVADEDRGVGDTKLLQLQLHHRRISLRTSKNKRPHRMVPLQ